jgi:NADPH:quinone reductase-like Zn-dependent oxidoreductase
MKAAVYEKFGQPSEVLQYTDVEKPIPSDDEVLVRIHASSINFGDNALLSGKPFMIRLMGYGIFKPKYRITGGDIAGRVESVGKDVKQFQPGDEVYADIWDNSPGAYAEYVAVPEKLLVPKPVNLTFEEAAAFPQASVVALQGLRDKGQIQAGHKVLINGASGGVGTFAVQIAKAFGAEVTGVCSTRNMELVRSLGADHVIDYTKEDFTKNGQQYDIIFDVVPGHSFSDYMRALSPEGTLVSVALNVGLLLSSTISKTGRKKVIQLTHVLNAEDLVLMKELIEAGKIVPVIDRTFPLSEAAEAFRYYADGRSKGKVVLTMGPTQEER